MITVCCDDEPLSLRRLTGLLRAHPDIDLRATCGSAAQAVEAVVAHGASLLVADIQMPEGNGLELVRSLGGDLPAVIFVTAHAEHAVSAFDLAAVDYVLKPYSKERLYEAIARARARPEALAPLAQTTDRLPCKADGQVRYVPLSQVDAVRANGKHCEVLLDSSAMPLAWPLSEAESRLPTPPFYRANRSTIVNLDRLKVLNELINGRAEMLMRSGRTIWVSRRARRALRQRLG